jgi:putative endonuclease
VQKRVSLGQKGEDIAARSLQENGYEIVTRNWHCREGEIDIVARHEDTLVFVEVRTRRSDRFGSPEESITAAKRARLVSACQTYLMEIDEEDPDWRIDFIAIEMGRTGQVKRLNHIECAF